MLDLIIKNGACYIDNDLKNVKSVRSHSQAISQCQKLINSHKFETIIAADTAGSAKYISEKKIKNEASIASDLAAKIYDLKIVKNMQKNTIFESDCKKTYFPTVFGARFRKRFFL